MLDKLVGIFSENRASGFNIHLITARGKGSKHGAERS